MVMVMVQWSSRMAGWDPKSRSECNHCYGTCLVVSKASEHPSVSLGRPHRSSSGRPKSLVVAGVWELLVLAAQFVPKASRFLLLYHLAVTFCYVRIPR